MGKETKYKVMKTAAFQAGMAAKKEETGVDNSTKKLLEECSSGCKMALNSMEQVKKFIQDEKLGEVMEDYEKKHRKLEIESTRMLAHAGQEEKDPPAAATAFSWVTTEAKLRLNNSSSQIAKLMMDGCNMGIQSISEAVNKYQNASKASTDLAQELVTTEERFMGDLKDFL